MLDFSWFQALFVVVGCLSKVCGALCAMSRKRLLVAWEPFFMTCVALEAGLKFDGDFQGDFGFALFIPGP